MPYLYTNLPSQNIFIPSEYLTNGKTEGQQEQAILTGVRAFHGHGLVFEAYVPKYGALYDKLPIKALQHKSKLSYDLPHTVLELWDTPSYWLTCYEKSYIAGCTAYVWDGKQYHEGTYLFTLDFAPPPDSIDLTDTQDWEEAKSKNIIALKNGQFCACPNNRMRIFVPSVTHKDFKENKPEWASPSYDWKVERRTFGVNNTEQWAY